MIWLNKPPNEWAIEKFPTWAFCLFGFRYLIDWYLVMALDKKNPFLYILKISPQQQWLHYIKHGTQFQRNMKFMLRHGNSWVCYQKTTQINTIHGQKSRKQGLVIYVAKSSIHINWRKKKSPGRQWFILRSQAQISWSEFVPKQCNFPAINLENKDRNLFGHNCKLLQKNKF